MRKIKNEQKGSVLIVLIITMVIMGTLGASMYLLTSTSTFGSLFANKANRALLLAESGMRFAIAKGITTFNTTPTPYTLNSGVDKFTIAYSSTTGVVTAIGIADADSVWHVQRQLTFWSWGTGPAPSTGGPTGPIDLDTHDLLQVKTGGVDEMETPDNGLSVKLDLDEGHHGKSVTLSNDTLSYPGDYLMQIKLRAGDDDKPAESWIMGLRFNMDASYKYGYWLTLVNASNGGFEDDQGVNNVIPDVGHPYHYDRKSEPTLLLWQNTPEHGYQWIAYADIKNEDVMTGGLTDSDHSDKWYIGKDHDHYPTIVVRVQRVGATNVIRAYIGGPDNKGSANGTPNDNNKRGYAKWTSLEDAADHEIKWPSPSLTGTWGTWNKDPWDADPDTNPYAGDFFTIAGEQSSGSLVKWVLNPNADITAHTTLTSDVKTKTGSTINNAVITSTLLTGSAYSLVGLYADLISDDECTFYNWGIEATGGSSGTTNAGYYGY